MIMWWVRFYICGKKEEGKEGGSQIERGMSTERKSAADGWRMGGGGVPIQGVGPDTTLAWPGWKQPDIPVEVDTDRLETSCTEAGVLKKLSLD